MAVACCNNVEIDRLHKIPLQTFEDNYLKHGKPVVIEGAVDNWPARNWTLESLCQVAGQNTVYVRSNTNCQDYKLGKKYNIRQTTFKNYIADFKAGNNRARNSYLAVQNIKKSFPQLQNDIIVPEYVGKVHGGPYLWIALKGHYEYCHIDPDDGVLVILQGSKQVRLFGCDPVPLYPNPKGSKGRTIQSLVDCDNPDLEAHPLFRGVTCYHCVLKPGDMLYIPAFWWHQVSTVEDSISVNIFWGDAGTNTFLTKVMSQPVWPAFSHWLLNIVEQNRPYPSFIRILSRLPETLPNLLLKQWHETPTEDQLNCLVKLVMDYLGIEKLPEEKSSGKNPPSLQIRGLLWRS